MVTFSTLWTNIVSALKTNFGELGVDQDKIKKGVIEFDSKGDLKVASMKPPFILVYMVPDTQKLYENSLGSKRRAEIAILCTAAPHTDPSQGVDEVVAIGEGIEKVIADNFPSVVPEEPIMDIPVNNASVTRGIVNFKGYYKSSKAE